MAKSEASKSGCFSAIFRHLLCSGSVPTHPSDHIIDSKTAELSPNPEKDGKKKPQTHAQSRPGVVARLMGLDSLPADTNWVPKESARDSFSRSRSVNFADYLLNLDLSTSTTTAEVQQHRRVRTSVSFREVPASFQQQNGDFLVVYLDSVDEESKKETRKSEMGYREKQGKKKEKTKNKENKIDQSLRLKNKKENEITNNKISKLKNEPRRNIQRRTSKNCEQNRAKVLGSVLPYKKKIQNNVGVKLKTMKPEIQTKVPEKFTRKRRNREAAKKIQPTKENIGNLSSASFLDGVYDILIQHDALFSGDYSMPLDSNIKTRSEPKDSCSNGKRSNGKTQNKDMADYTELAELLKRLAEEDLSNSYWSNSKAKINEPNFEGFEDICIEFEKPVLDMLLHEVITEILEIS